MMTNDERQLKDIHIPQTKLSKKYVLSGPAVPNSEQDSFRRQGLHLNL